MKPATKTQIRKSMKDLRESIRALEDLLKDDDWQGAHEAAQQLVGTSCLIEDMTADREEEQR
jgi:hypothetical protein